MITPCYKSVVGTIGQTPLVELSRLTAGLDGRILAKLDYLNPGFSKKDRIARQIIEDAEANGALQPGHDPGGLILHTGPLLGVALDREGVGDQLQHQKDAPSAQGDFLEETGFGA